MKRKTKCECGGKFVQSGQININDVGQPYLTPPRCNRCDRRLAHSERAGWPEVPSQERS